MAVGMGAGVVTFGGILAGSYGLIAVGSAMGTSAAVINSTEHVMDGNYGAAFSEALLAPVSSAAFSLVGSARNLTPAERLVSNYIIFKSENIANLGITISTYDRK
jgi:hypothetical protein